MSPTKPAATWPLHHTTSPPKLSQQPRNQPHSRSAPPRDHLHAAAAAADRRQHDFRGRCRKEPTHIQHQQRPRQQQCGTCAAAASGSGTRNQLRRLTRCVHQHQKCKSSRPAAAAVHWLAVGNNHSLCLTHDQQLRGRRPLQRLWQAVPSHQQQGAAEEDAPVAVDPAQLAREKQLLAAAAAGKGFSLHYTVPWDIWLFVQVAAAVWVVNQTIPYAVLSSAAHLQGLPQLSDLPLAEKEVLGLLCQVVQLASTYSIITAATNKYQPLEPPWLAVVPGAVPVLQGFATAIAAVGSGVLLSGVLTGHVDGAEEWRHLAGMHADKTGVAALVLGAVVLAPLTEELYFRGFVLPSLTRWMSPLAAVPLTGLLFASAHPADAFPAEALLGCILSLSLFAADGNLLVPLLAHSLYNLSVLGAEFLLV